MVAKDHKGKDKGTVIPARAVIEQRVRYGIWFINPRNPYVRRIEPGDRGQMLALGKEERQFMGELTINSGPLPVDSALEALMEGLPSTMLTHYLKITAILRPRPKPLESVLHELDFVKNRSKWYAFSQDPSDRLRRRRSKRSHLIREASSRGDAEQPDRPPDRHDLTAREHVPERRHLDVPVGEGDAREC